MVLTGNHWSLTDMFYVFLLFRASYNLLLLISRNGPLVILSSEEVILIRHSLLINIIRA